MQFVVIGNSENRRVELFQKALVGLGLEPARLISYRELLAGAANLEKYIMPGCVVRIESPDRDFEVEKALLKLGAEVADEEGELTYARYSKRELANLAFDKGAILYSRQWFLGFRQLLSQLHTQLQTFTGYYLMNHPADILTMFDKPATHTLLSQNNIAVPPSLGVVHSYAELLEKMQAQKCYRVFVKPAHGSSASGVVAYQFSGDRHLATTSVETVDGSAGLKLYNSRQLRTYRNQTEIARLLDELCRHRVHVERWLPKAGLGNRTLDLRVVVIGGSARHVVVRGSQNTLTNLHLSNERLSLTAFLEKISPAAWEAARSSCEQVMQLFPQSLYAGVDLLIASNYRDHAIAEVNAFGDLLYETYYVGKDTYTWEIETMLQRNYSFQPPTPNPFLKEGEKERVFGGLPPNPPCWGFTPPTPFRRFG